MDRAKVIKDIAKRLQLLEGNGQLRKLDSLAIIDFVLELEKSLKIAIPVNDLKDEYFRSLESIQGFVDRIGR